MIDFDLPYGIEYGFNFQPFVNKCDIKDRSDEDLTQKPEMIKKKSRKIVYRESSAFFVTYPCAASTTKRGEICHQFKDFSKRLGSIVCSKTDCQPLCACVSNF